MATQDPKNGGKTSDAPPAVSTTKPGAKRIVLTALALIAIGAGAWFGWDWWTVGRFTESTDDAYAKADIVTYSAQVPGRISAIEVPDNTQVKAGQVLLRIDDTRLKSSLAEAEAQVASAKAAIVSTDAQIALQSDNIASAKANLASAQAALDLAQTNAERSQALLERGATPKASTDQQAKALEQAQAALRGAKAGLDVARGQLPVLKAQRSQQEAALHRAEAAEALAQKNLDDTVIRASRDGMVGNRGVEVGEYVGVGTKLISLVPLDAIYVTANFKETQVEKFRPGMKADVSSDMLGGVHLKGVIDSIAPATGSQFALIPTENATGNFTKIVQRIPVRIHITAPQTTDGPSLRPGSSVVVDIDTRGARE
ncbi:HlyD family secretion protein [Thioclava sp. F28-4]|uniref:HlyD family secretion protein n=1 Tax=Thioclava sp. F28-4 TaxID=1915315 RepID=UPI0009984AB7|nr:HlyD family secretion protein [Thioclava sp. F28-4]OOY04579.1 hypothetical protein BMI87_10175 [Thioclava sp. F28-4]